MSFCFDDFPRSALLDGGRMLDAFGVRATYYAAMRFLNGKNDFGDGFTLADLEELVAKGHELGCHTFDHLNATMTDPGRSNIGSLNRHELRANQLYSERVPLQTTQDIIRENREVRGWLPKAG